MKMRDVYSVLSAMVLFMLLWSGCQSKQEGKNKIPFFIGTYTSEGAEGIYLSYLDTITEGLSDPQLVAKLSNPSYFTLSEDGKFLFAVSENDGFSEDLFVFHRETVNNQLTLVDSLQTKGRGACYVSEILGKYLVVAHYSSGDVVFVPYGSDGHLHKEGMKQFTHHGSGPILNRQESSHVHSAVPDLMGEFVYVADLGTDEVRVYQLGGDSITVKTYIAVKPGSGPRHISFHPKGKIMALLNELNSTINLYELDSVGVFSNLVQSIQLLPDSTGSGSLAADIHFSQDGKNLYASVRGIDRIYTLSVNADGAKVVESLEDEISWPRNFVQDPTGNFLLVANQNGGNIIVYKRNMQSGKLTLLENKVEISQPVCLKF